MLLFEHDEKFGGGFLANQQIERKPASAALVAAKPRLGSCASSAAFLGRFSADVVNDLLLGDSQQ